MEVTGRIFGLIILVMVLTTAAVNRHALYISVVELEKTKAPQQTKLTVKVFTDDLQDVLRNYSKSYIPGENQLQNNLSIIEKYFNEYLIIDINGQRKSYDLTSIKKENDAHFLIFSVEGNEKWDSIQVKALYFTELFPDQSNIITVINGDKKLYGRFTKSSPSRSFTLN